MASFVVKQRGWVIEYANGEPYMEGTKGEIVKEAFDLALKGHTITGDMPVPEPHNVGGPEDDEREQ